MGALTPSSQLVSLWCEWIRAKKFKLNERKAVVTHDRHAQGGSCLSGFLFPPCPDHSWAGGRASPSSRRMCFAGHLFYKFGITESDWYRIKQSIDSKCRTAWRRKQRGQSLAVKSFSRRTPSSSSYGASGLWAAGWVIWGHQRQRALCPLVPWERLPCGCQGAERPGLGSITRVSARTSGGLACGWLSGRPSGWCSDPPSGQRSWSSVFPASTCVRP